MKKLTARERILGRLRATASETPLLETKTTHEEKALDIDLLEVFGVNFTLASGRLRVVKNHKEAERVFEELCVCEGWQSIFCPENLLTIPAICGLETAAEKADVSLTACEALVAEFGAIMVSARQMRAATVLPPCHVVLANRTQLLRGLGEALQCSTTSSMWSFITGPSRTADIEKTLVMGAHGPKSLYLILVL